MLIWSLLSGDLTKYHPYLQATQYNYIFSLQKWHYFILKETVISLSKEKDKRFRKKRNIVRIKWKRSKKHKPQQISGGNLFFYHSIMKNTANLGRKVVILYHTTSHGLSPNKIKWCLINLWQSTKDRIVFFSFNNIMDIYLQKKKKMIIRFKRRKHCKKKKKKKKKKYHTQARWLPTPINRPVLGFKVPWSRWNIRF